VECDTVLFLITKINIEFIHRYLAMTIAQSSDLVASMLSRRSNKLVQAPGPTPEQLNQILQTAVCAPDHAAMRAWRFVLIEQSEIAAFTDLAIDAKLGGIFNMGGAAVANYCSILERVG
jgi:nitroreductase